MATMYKAFNLISASDKRDIWSQKSTVNTLVYRNINRPQSVTINRYILNERGAHLSLFIMVLIIKWQTFINKFCDIILLVMSSKDCFSNLSKKKKKVHAIKTNILQTLFNVRVGI